MAKSVPLRQALIFWIATIGSAVLVYYGGQASEFLISDTHAAAATRWAGVALGVFAIVPWLAIVIVTLSVVDEYYRRVALVGTTIAFVLDLMLHVGFSIATNAQLVGRGFFIPELVSAIITWFIGVSIALVYYRYRL